MEVGQHEQAMIAKFEAAGGNGSAPIPPITATGKPPAADPPAPPTRPDYIPEKFWDAEKGVANYEALAKSYIELEKARSKPPEKAPEKPAEGEQKAPEGDTSKLDMAALAEEFQANGSLTPETYSKLEAIGFGKDVVDAYIAGQQALAAQRDAKGYEAVGGKENFEKIAAWAKTALSDAEKAAYDAAVQGPIEGMLLAVQGLKARYEAAFGKEPNLALGNSGSANEGGFASRAEMVAAMRDPRYKTDSAYRAQVERRVALMPD